jgi:TRAP-type mannitol/chloroaromatic compound transport system substrate-binding protein
MKNRKLVTAFMVLVVIITIGTGPALAKTIKWKVQSLFGSGELTYKTFVDFSKNVEKMTNGRLVMKPMPAGTIVPTFDLLEAVQDNVLQAMHTGAAYYSGKEPAMAIFSDLLYAYNAPWEPEAWFYYGGGRELINEAYNKFGATCIGVIQWGFESFPSKFPIRNMNDYKGHKFRSPQGMSADMLAMLGAGVVILPGGEVYSALDKGVIEGADWGSPSMNYRMGFDQVAKYFVYPEYRSLPISDFTVNTREWNRLPDDIKAIVQAAVRAWNQETIQRVALDDRDAIRKMEAKGVKAVSWKKEDVQALREFVRRNVWPEWAKKSPLSKKMHDSQLKWLKRIGNIK